MTRDTRQPIRWRAIALPAEHGSWGFVGEPLALGLLVAPSAAGVGLALGLLFLFLLRWPLKMAVQSGRQKRRRRARAAAALALVYALLTAAGLGSAIWLGGMRPFLPLLFALPLTLIFLTYDLTNRSRALPAELSAAAGFAAGVASIALAGGLPMGPAMGLWGVLAARAVPSILYVRARLRLEKGQPVARWPALGSHAVAALALGALALFMIPFWPAVGASVLLLGRAAWGLSARRRPLPAKWIGIGELLWGLVVVLAGWGGF